MTDRELTAYVNKKRNEYLKKYRREHPEKAYAARLRDAITFCRRNGCLVLMPDEIAAFCLNGGVPNDK